MIAYLSLLGSRVVGEKGKCTSLSLPYGDEGWPPAQAPPLRFYCMLSHFVSIGRFLRRAPKSGPSASRRAAASAAKKSVILAKLQPHPPHTTTTPHTQHTAHDHMRDRDQCDELA
jgi:hypothetical protein